MSRQLARPRALVHFPPSLQKLVQCPKPDCLHLLLETSGAKATWLAHRYASAALEQADTNVILVTWSQSTQYWLNELRKSANIDVDRLLRSRHLTILDDLDFKSVMPDKGQTFAETSQSKLNTAIRSLPTDRSALLVLDSPDLLLGLEDVPADHLLSLIVGWRLAVKSTVILTSSDVFRTLSNEISASPLQLQQQHLLSSLLHHADSIMSTRVLDTGQAKDVSGVLRVTAGGQSEQATSREALDREYLYHVDASRTAHIWQRGAER